MSYQSLLKEFVKLAFRCACPCTAIQVPVTCLDNMSSLCASCHNFIIFSSLDPHCFAAGEFQPARRSGHGSVLCRRPSQQRGADSCASISARCTEARAAEEWMNECLPEHPQLLRFLVSSCVVEVLGVGLLVNWEIQKWCVDGINIHEFPKYWTVHIQASNTSC